MYGGLEASERSMVAFEQELIALEGRLLASHKAARDLLEALRRAERAARLGHVGDIERRLGEVRERTAEAGASAAALDGAWSFDLATYMADGGYLTELEAAAAEAGLRLFEKDGRIYCFPLLLRLDPRERAIRVGRKRERRTRPKEVARLLAKAQKRPQRFDEPQFLELLYSAYFEVTGHDGQGAGRVVSLAELHDLLTLFPGTDYPVEEFARDLLLLDRKPDLRTRDGCRFEFPTSTGSKGGGRRIVVYDEDGRERLYVGIRFVKDA
jgi:hypothetical protein